MNEIIKLIEKPGSVDFNQIKISIASPDEIVSWSHGHEIKNQKQLTIEPLNPSEVVYFVQEYLVLLKIMSVFVENIKE